MDAASSVTQVAAAGKGRTHDLISRHPLSSPFPTPGCVVRLIITRPEILRNCESGYNNSAQLFVKDKKLFYDHPTHDLISILQTPTFLTIASTRLTGEVVDYSL